MSPGSLESGFDKRRQILEIIRQSYREHGRSPTQKVIEQQVGLANVSTYISILVEQGYLKRLGHYQGVAPIGDEPYGGHLAGRAEHSAAARQAARLRRAEEQDAIMQVIREWRLEHGAGPTQDQLAQHLHKARSGVNGHLAELRAAGRVTWTTKRGSLDTVPPTRAVETEPAPQPQPLLEQQQPTPEPSPTMTCPSCADWQPPRLDFGHDGIGHRTSNTVTRAGIRDYATLAQMNDTELMQIRNMGAKSVSRIREVVAQQDDEVKLVHQLRQLLHQAYDEEGIVDWLSRRIDDLEHDLKYRRHE